MAPQCTALNVSDESRCEEEASSLNGLFCQYHSKQCQALYKGYKRRNAHLDSLAKESPKYLADNVVPLANQTFKDITSEEVLRELRAHLSLRHALLDRVIRARKLHHSRFFSMTLDYGHQAYLDTLSNQKFITLQALQRLERRTAEVLYQRRTWFKWVRTQQDEEEARRDSEKKRIRHEAALFKRHWAQVKQHIKEMRMKEDLKRQEDYLEEAFKARMNLEEDNAWDPIEDVVEDERGSHVDMLKLFLFMNDGTLNEPGPIQGEPPLEKPSKKKAKGQKGDTAEDGVGKSGSESKLQMRERLRQGTKHIRAPGMYVAGTIELPIETYNSSAPLPDEEIDQLLQEITEIKQLLFCRMILSHASLLPAALRARSVEEFLSDEEVSLADLRAICLKMENPGWQEVRDACADLFRGDEGGGGGAGEGGGGGESQEKDDTKEQATTLDVTKLQKSINLPNWRRSFRKGPQIWPSTLEQHLRKQRQRRQKILDKSTGESEGKLIDFGAFDDKTEPPGKKLRIKICGRSIYNYPSEKAMNRGGWLHFSIIAKNSALSDAVTLCRHWDEFFELCTLTVFQFFPAGSWIEWMGDRLHQQLLRLGFMPYHEFRKAEERTVHHQSGSRGQMRRSHAFLEARNFIAGYVKRNDPASRRLIQYLSMQTYRVLLLVRDARTGEIVISPPKDQLWLLREKSGLGRAVKHEWRVLKEVGPEFFKEMEVSRRWNLGFNDYYDVIIWDLNPGEPFGNVYSSISDMLFKAHRVHNFKESYKLCGPILETLTRDTESFRVREIRANEESVKSIFDDIHSGDTFFKLFNEQRQPLEKIPKDLFYNDADALEDKVLFAEEDVGPGLGLLARGDTNELNKLEFDGPNMERFVYDLDTDEELPEDDDLEHTCGDSEDPSENADDWDEYEDEEDDDFDSQNTDSEEREPISEELKAFIDYFTRHTPKRDPDENMEEQFDQFVRRESSRAFKEGWHQADLEPGARERYLEAMDLVEKMEICLRQKRPHFTLRLPVFLDVHPEAHRRVFRDMKKALAMMALFFPVGFEKMIDDYEGDLAGHMIINQGERAKTRLDRRTPQSNKLRGLDFFKEFEDVFEKNHEWCPNEWDQALRPIVAKLYKEGILRNSYHGFVVGQAFAHQEPGRPLDLFIDFRVVSKEIRLDPGMQEPPRPASLLSSARTFARQHSSARFALLRLWSAPHFWPLIIGIEKRAGMTFQDSQGRAWEWKFIPKDMPYSDWSVHQQARLRIQPFRKKFGDKVIAMRDVFLVMGCDQEELLMLAAGTTYAVQTDPWRLEVDLWRSFVNVDLEFLENLHDQWWE